MAEKPRSLAAALSFSPEAAEFIQGASRKTSAPPRPVSKSSQAVRLPKRREESSTGQVKETKPKRRTRPQPPVSEKKETATTRAKIAITTRFSQETAEALRRESLQRKLRNETLHTQQDIIELAVSTWLRKEKGGESVTSKGNE